MTRFINNQRQKKSNLGWHLLTFSILMMLALGIYYSAIKNDYKWHWERIPQFVLAKHDRAVTSPELTTVTKIENHPQYTTVILTQDNGKEYLVKVDTPSLRVAKDDQLNDGDTVGSISTWQAGPLLIGLWTTLWLSFVSGIIGLLIGILTGLCRISKNPTLYTLSTIYVEIIRGTPLLVQLMIFYYFIGTIFKLNSITAAIMALAIFVGAYIAEILRSGIQSLDKGQMEAARSLGMNRTQALRYVILPQAFKRIIPPLTGQLITLVKDSSLVSVITILDLTKAARESATSSYYTLEIWFTAAFLYLLINLLLSRLSALLETRLQYHD